VTTPAHSPIYLDHHATTPVDPRVFEAMLPWLSSRWGNAASIGHSFGHEAAAAVETARASLASSLNCPPESLYFTSGATEANNLAIKGLMQGAGRSTRLVVNAAEHRAVLDPARRLRRNGCDVVTLPVDSHGRVDPDSVREALKQETRLVSVMLANNEVGTLNRVAQIAAICHERGAWLHCDAAQAVGKIPVDLAALGVDLLSFTAHKLYGPQGIGALYSRPADPPLHLTPLFDGGGHERGLRSGTLPVPLIVGFARALEVALGDLPDESTRLASLRDRLLHGLQHHIPDITIHGHPTQRLPGNLNVGFAGIDGDALLAGVAAAGLAVSSGSACTSANPEPSHVLRAMGVPDRLARASLRFGVGRFNTESEIDHAVQIVAGVVRRLRD
jgi:cysteine desulfurase